MSADRCPTCASVAAELADELATAQAEIDHAVAGLAVASMLPSMSRLRHGATPTVRAWLGRLVERLRGGAVDSDAAKDRDAAKWCRVEPLIDRLCGAVGAAHLVSRAESERRITEIASAILAATKEPS